MGEIKDLGSVLKEKKVERKIWHTKKKMGRGTKKAVRGLTNKDARDSRKRC